MAKVTGPLFSLSASGDVGGSLNYAQIGGQAIVRGKIQRHSVSAEERLYYRLWTNFMSNVVKALVFYDWNQQVAPYPISWANWYQGGTGGGQVPTKNPMTPAQLRARLWGIYPGPTFRQRYEYVVDPTSVLGNAISIWYADPRRFEAFNRFLYLFPDTYMPVLFRGGPVTITEVPVGVVCMAVADIVELLGYPRIGRQDNFPLFLNLGKVSPRF